jgi:hypothetical protein
VPGEYLPPQELAGVLQAKLQMWDRRCRSPHVCAGCVQSACRVCAGCVQCLCAKWGIAAKYLFLHMFDLRSALSLSLSLSLSRSLARSRARALSLSRSLSLALSLSLSRSLPLSLSRQQWTESFDEHIALPFGWTAVVDAKSNKVP